MNAQKRDKAAEHDQLVRKLKLVINQPNNDWLAVQISHLKRAEQEKRDLIEQIKLEVLKDLYCAIQITGSFSREVCLD